MELKLLELNFCTKSWKSPGCKFSYSGKTGVKLINMMSDAMVGLGRVVQLLRCGHIHSSKVIIW